VAGSSALWEAFRSRTGGLGDRVAVEASDGSLTFGELWSEAGRSASLLRDGGVEEGSIVGLSLRNSTRFLVTFLALCRLDATVALLSPDYRQGELTAIANGAGLASIVADVPVEHFAGAGDAGEDEALLKFSSGSTAEPKGIALTAGNVLAEAKTVAASLELRPGDAVLAGVPLFHSYGFDLGVLPTLVAGSTLVLEQGFVPRRTLAALASGVTAFLGVPAQYRAFLDARLDSPPDLATVRWLLSCTAPLAPETVVAFAERFGAPICQHYGSSETGAVTTHVPSEVLARPTSVGRAMQGVDITLDDGEVVVSSGAVARRYVLGAPPEPSPLGEGTFRTGDLGRLDADGFLTLLGRTDALINVGGLKVSPAEVAATLERHPAVREAAVLGVPDGRGEEVVYAVVASAGAAEETKLLAFCRAGLAEYKVPRRIEIRDELPRTAAGKVRLRVEDLEL
jgi:acyl-CoA synthetase (AMP-forming)/AMP-acid ligase II